MEADGTISDILEMDFFGFYALQRFIQNSACLDEAYIVRLSRIKGYKYGKLAFNFYYQD